MTTTIYEAWLPLMGDGETRKTLTRALDSMPSEVTDSALDVVSASEARESLPRLREETKSGGIKMIMPRGQGKSLADATVMMSAEKFMEIIGATIQKLMEREALYEAPSSLLKGLEPSDPSVAHVKVRGRPTEEVIGGRRKLDI